MLGLITHLRKMLATTEDPPYTQILRNTKLMQIIGTVLSFEPEAGDVYVMKLECYWLLINLSCCQGQLMKIVLGDNSPNSVPYGDTLRKIQTDLVRIQHRNCKDAKTLKMILTVLMNVMLTDRESLALVVKNTSAV